MVEKEIKAEVYLAGIGLGTEETMTGETARAVRECDCLIGASRMVDSALSATQANPKKIVREYNSEKIIQAVRETYGQSGEFHTFCVVLSGDTGFYSGAKRLSAMIREGFPSVNVRILPGISSLIYFAARLGVSWQDAGLLSLHGEQPNYIHEILRREKVFMLLGRKGAGEEICEKLAFYGLGHLRLSIGTDLSYKSEKIIQKKACDASPGDFDGLSVVLFENDRPILQTAPMLTDDMFIRGAAPMTKEEIRTLSVACLGLKKDSVLYDIGAGTGSVGIQAAVSDGSVHVYAIEKKAEALRLIRENKRKFCTDFLHVVEGEAPGAMTDLPACTHAFVGGSGGELKDIIRLIRQKNGKTVIVINAISLETMGEVTAAIEEGLLPNAHVMQIQASRGRKIGRYHMMTGENPIYIVVSRPSEEDAANGPFAKVSQEGKRRVNENR